MGLDGAMGRYACRVTHSGAWFASPCGRVLPLACQSGAPVRPQCTYSEYLRTARIRAGMSQKGVAIELRVSPASVCLWEQGRRIPKTRHLFMLARLYGWSDSRIVTALRLSAAGETLPEVAGP